MINWWVAMIIGAVTMIVGYKIGLGRAGKLLRMCSEAVDEAMAIANAQQEMIRAMIKDLEDECKSEGCEG